MLRKESRMKTHKEYLDKQLSDKKFADRFYREKERMRTKMDKTEWYEIADMAAEYVVSELYPIVLYPSKASRQVRKDEKEKFSGTFLRIITAKLSSPCPFTGDSEKAEVFDEENDTFPYVVCSKWPGGCGKCARSEEEN